MRLIDGDALLKKFNRKVADVWTALTDEDTADDFAFYCKLADAVEEMPTIGDWIKCTPDTMHETNDEVLTTYIVNGNKKRRFVESASWFYDGEEGHWNSVWDEYRVAGTRKEVLAWMPMPKPYKPSKED